MKGKKMNRNIWFLSLVPARKKNFCLCVCVCVCVCVCRTPNPTLNPQAHMLPPSIDSNLHTYVCVYPCPRFESACGLCVYPPSHSNPLFHMYLVFEIFVCICVCVHVCVCVCVCGFVLFVFSFYFIFILFLLYFYFMISRSCEVFLDCSTIKRRGKR